MLAHRRPTKISPAMAIITIWLLSWPSSGFQSRPLFLLTSHRTLTVKKSLSLHSAPVLVPLVNGRSTKISGKPCCSQTFKLVPKAPKDKEEYTDPFVTSTKRGDAPICRIVTRSDSMLPRADDSTAPINRDVFERMDAIYHALAHEETRQLTYMQSKDNLYDAQDEKELVRVARSSLEDAGFQLMSRRDLDLCDALNAGYLLRLSLLPDTEDQDPTVFRDFYPKLFNDSGELLNGEDMLFDGRVLVFWRGYSNEVSEGRLLLPKIDYLQASLVQRTAAWVRRKLNVTERWLVVKLTVNYRKARRKFRSLFLGVVGSIPVDSFNRFARDKDVFNETIDSRALDLLPLPGKLFTLSRYGGSKVRFVTSPDTADALKDFVICEEQSEYLSSQETKSGYFDTLPVDNELLDKSVENDIYEFMNSGDIMCPYDESNSSISPSKVPPMQLLKRVSLGNLVDTFSKDGRKKLLDTLLAKSTLIEPTYAEVVVVWRSQPKTKMEKPILRIPSWIYDLADMFDIENLPPRPEAPKSTTPSQLEIRAFNGVPMANVLAVLPKTKLVFRPADAFVFDFISLASLSLVIGSLRFDNPRLDLLALVSVTLWTVRTFFRYSNKLARYDLLVKTFLTSKISHRNKGALKYVATEAGSQRAMRASVLHSIFAKRQGNDNEPLERNELIQQAESVAVGGVFGGPKKVPIDVDAAFDDLEDLNLIRSTRDDRFVVVSEDESVLSTLKKAWNDVFCGRLNLRNITRKRRSTKQK